MADHLIERMFGVPVYGGIILPVLDLVQEIQIYNFEYQNFLTPQWRFVAIYCKWNL